LFWFSSEVKGGDEIFTPDNSVASEIAVDGRDIWRRDREDEIREFNRVTSWRGLSIKRCVLKHVSTLRSEESNRKSHAEHPFLFFLPLISSSYFMEQINYLKLKFHSIFSKSQFATDEYSPLKDFYDSPLPHPREYSNHGNLRETQAQNLLSQIDVPILNLTSSQLSDAQPDQPKEPERIWSTKISNWRLLIFSPSTSDQESKQGSRQRTQLKFNSFPGRISDFVTYLRRVAKPLNQADQDASDILMQEKN
jgi:hypothetical protein